MCTISCRRKLNSMRVEGDGANVNVCMWGGSSYRIHVYSCMCAMCMYRWLQVLVEARGRPSLSFFRNGPFFFFSRQDLTLTGHWQAGWAEWLVSYVDSLLSPSLVLGLEVAPPHLGILCEFRGSSSGFYACKARLHQLSYCPFFKRFFSQKYISMLHNIKLSFHYALHWNSSSSHGVYSVPGVRRNKELIYSL